MYCFCVLVVSVNMDEESQRMTVETLLTMNWKECLENPYNRRKQISQSIHSFLKETSRVSNRDSIAYCFENSKKSLTLERLPLT